MVDYQTQSFLIQNMIKDYIIDKNDMKPLKYKDFSKVNNVSDDNYDKLFYADDKSGGIHKALD